MEKNTHIHNSIDYIEFPVTDMEKSKKFYSTIFKWEFIDYSPSYAGIKKENGEAGGLSLQEKSPTRGGPLIVIFSKDLDKTLQLAIDVGTEIITEPFEFPGGRRFHFLDPSGNELAVWSLK